MNINIVVDNDEILFDLHNPLILFHNEGYGTNLEKKDFISYNLHEVWGGTPEEAIRKVSEFFESDYFKNLKPIEGSQKAMNHLKERGHTLYVVTGRIHSLAQKTEEDIQKYFPGIFSGICFANTYGTSGVKTKKSILCRRLNSKIIIEDDPFHINDCANDGMTVLVKDYPWNQVVLPRNAARFADWKQATNLIARHASKFRY